MALTQKQKQMDVDGDGAIGSDDLSALRKSKETVKEMQKGGRVVLKPLMRKRG
jgi:lysozyme family protein